MTTTPAINGHAVYRNHTDALTEEYVLGCLALDLERLNITAPIARTLMSEFFTPAPHGSEPGVIYPLTTGDHLTDCQLFDLRARLHEQQWKREAQERAKQENLPITTTVEPATNYVPETALEEGAQRVTVSLDGTAIEHLIMFPAKGETLTGLITAHGYTN